VSRSTFPAKRCCLSAIEAGRLLRLDAVTDEIDWAWMIPSGRRSRRHL